jgi:hypothetical protein
MHLIQDPQAMRDEGPRPGQVWSLNGHIVVVRTLEHAVARCLVVHDHPRLTGPGDLVGDLVACPGLEYPIPLAWFKVMEPLRLLGRVVETRDLCRHWRWVTKILKDHFSEVLEDYFEWYDATYD